MNERMLFKPEFAIRTLRLAHPTLLPPRAQRICRRRDWQGIGG